MGETGKDRNRLEDIVGLGAACIIGYSNCTSKETPVSGWLGPLRWMGLRLRVLELVAMKMGDVFGQCS